MHFAAFACLCVCSDASPLVSCASMDLVLVLVVVGGGEEEEVP